MPLRHAEKLVLYELVLIDTTVNTVMRLHQFATTRLKLAEREVGFGEIASEVNSLLFSVLSHAEHRFSPRMRATAFAVASMMRR